jgi:hypothetical protein
VSGDDDGDDDAWGEETYAPEPELSDWEDLPDAERDEEEHRRFVERELDAGGSVRREPPVGLVIALLTALVVGVAILVL